MALANLSALGFKAGYPAHMKIDVTVCILCLFAFNGRVRPRPFPEDGGTVTQSGEPSHFQVDDKAAEIEVNANPAGVKVNAKPASLQVVAKPGTPAIPIFHPAIHLAQHYAPPPVIHHHPAMFYHSGYHLPFVPFGHQWFYNGIKRQKFPRPTKDETEVRTHKSDIPRTIDHKRGSKSRKRQFISAAPKFVQPSLLSSPGGLNAYGTYGYGTLPQYALLGSGLGAYGARHSPQTAGVFALPSQLTPQQSLQESGLSRSFLPSGSSSRDGDNADALRGYQSLYSELNGLTSLYNSLLRQRSLNSLRDLQYGNALGAPGVNAEGSSLSLVPSYLGATQYGDAMGYGRTYIPSPLAQLYSAQSALPLTNGLLGGSLVGQQPLARYADLSSLMRRSPMVSRSKVPGSPEKKVKKHHPQKHFKDKRKIKRQTLVEPILEAEDPGSVDDLLQDDVSQNYKRQLVLTPALEALQQLQPLQPAFTQQALQPQPLQLRQLQLQQQLLQEQPFARQSLGLPPVGLEQQVGMQPSGIQQQVSMAGPQSLGNILSLDSTPLRYMTSSLVTPMANPGPNLAGRSLPVVSQRMASPLAPSLVSSSFAPSSLMSPLISNAFSRPRNDLNSFTSLSSRGLLQDRSLFHHPLRLGYPTYTRRILHRPQYRRRLHNFREVEDVDGFHPEVIGHEGVTQEGSYSTEEVPSSEGQTLINSSVGFGPITVEAKTAEGARAAQAAGEDKRYSIDKPTAGKHTTKQKENTLT